MQAYLPCLLDLTWQEKLYTRQYQSIHSLVLFCHTQAITSLCHRTSLPNYQILEDENFWEELELESNHSETVLQLHDRWKKISPLAHLNTRQLIRLLQDEINPLIKAYEHIFIELQDKSFLKKIKTKIVKQTEENVEKIKQLRQLVYIGLQERVNVYQILKSKRQVDDIAAAFIEEINALNLFREPLIMASSLSEGMDDNQRMTIHDILSGLNQENINLDNAALKEIVLPIPRFKVKLLRTKEGIEKDKRSINNFIEEQKYENEENKKNPWRHWLESFSPSIRLAADFIWYWRHFLEAILFTILIQTVASFLLTWGLGGKYLTCPLILSWGYAFWQEIKNRKLHWKTKEIKESLHLLAQSQQFIDHFLSQTPLDLEHFDVDYFLSRTDQIKTRIKIFNKQLKKIGIFEKRMLPDLLIERIEAISSQLCQQNKKISDWLNMIAIYIAKRIGKDIEQGELQAASAEKWRQYVQCYGSEEAKLVFEQNANMIVRWGKKIPSFLTERKDDLNVTLGFPWKRYCLKDDEFIKWGKLLKIWITDEKKQQACLDIHSLLMRQKNLSREAFQQAIQALALESLQQRKIEKTIQTFLYKTLSGREAQTVALLSKEQQEKIRCWREAHLDLISKAHEILENILKFQKKYTDEELLECYRILDAEDFYDAVQENAENKKQRNNKVRQFFEEYQGQPCPAFQWLRFLPSQEREKWANEIALKRLEFLLQQGGIPRELSEEDIFILKNSWIFPARKAKIQAALEQQLGGKSSEESEKHAHNCA